jgi:hypothetical protein
MDESAAGAVFMGLHEAQHDEGISMNSKHDDNPELSELYDESVRHERDARLALQSLSPGSPERRQAWDEWSQAIVRTNRAWRQLSVSRVAQGHANA